MSESKNEFEQVNYFTANVLIYLQKLIVFIFSSSFSYGNFIIFIYNNYLLYGSFNLYKIVMLSKTNIKYLSLMKSLNIHFE